MKKKIVINGDFSLVPNKQEKILSWNKPQKEMIQLGRHCQHISYILPRQHGKTELALRMLVDFAFRYKKRAHPRAITTMTTIGQCVEYYTDRLDKLVDQLPSSIVEKSGSKRTSMKYRIFRPHIGDWATLVFTGTDTPKSLRGGTYDLVIADEAAFYKPSVIGQILEPFTDTTDGRMFLTSTVNGTEDEFWRTKLANLKSMQKYGKDSNRCHYERNVYDAGFHTKRWIQDKKDAYLAKQTLHEFEQEYENNPYAAAEGERPFANKIYELKKDPTRNIPEKSDDIYEGLLRSIPLWINMDIGKENNMATLFWRQLEGRLDVVEYKDDFNGLEELVDYAWEKYGQKYHRLELVCPADINQPNMLVGDSNWEGIKKYIYEKGLYNRVIINQLFKVVNKHSLWQHGLRKFGRYSWIQGETDAAVDGLASVRFIKNATTGYVEFGKPEKNGFQHMADAYLYMTETLDKKFAKSTRGEVYDDPHTRERRKRITRNRPKKYRRLPQGYKRLDSD